MSDTSCVHASFHHQLGTFLLDVTLNLPGRGVTAVFGHSGSGKTTLLRCVAGLERAARGNVRVNGEVWQNHAAGLFLPVHQRPLGVVFQEASLFAHLNVQHNLDYGLRRVPAAQRRVLLSQVVELLGLEPLLQRQPGALSGGERQRVAIARALATSPQLLLMDEPLAALDVQRKAEVLPYLARLHQGLDIPVLYISHAVDEVAQLAHHLVVLRAGRVLATGPVHELLTRVDLPLAQGDAASALIDAVVTHTEPAYHLSHAVFAGGQISLLDSHPPHWLRLSVGQQVRLRVWARDVSLTLQRQDNTSVLNIFAARVVAMTRDDPGQIMVTLALPARPDVDTHCSLGGRLLARITCKSADALQLQCGSAVYAQVKSVAVLG